MEDDQGIVENEKNQNKMQMRRKSFQEGNETVEKVRYKREEEKED